LLFESPSSLLKSPFSKARHGVDPCHFTFCILRCRMLPRSEILPVMGYSNITETAMILMSVATTDFDNYWSYYWGLSVELW
jgi:hypothetical protein